MKKEKPDIKSVIFKRVALFLFGILLPVIAFSASNNIMLRLPDVYQYEFKSSDCLKNVDVPYNDDDMGEFISDFMIWKNQNLEIREVDLETNEAIGENVFSHEEVVFAKKVRSILDKKAIILVLSLIYCISILIYAIAKWEKENIRQGLKYGIRFFMIMLIIYLGIYMKLENSPFMVMEKLGYAISEGDLLPQIITENMVLRLYLLVGIGAIVIMGIIWYAIRKITEPKRVFSRI